MHPMSDMSFLYLFVKVYHIIMKLYIFQVALADRLFDEILLLLAFVSYFQEHTIAHLAENQRTGMKIGENGINCECHSG